MFLRDGRMTLTAAVAMAAPAAVMIFVGRRLVVRALDPLMTRVLIIGTGPVTERLSWRLRRCNDVEVVGHVDDDVIGGDDVVGGVADLPALCAQLDIDRVVVAFHNSSDASVLNALHQLQGRVPISEIPRNFELHNWRSEPEEVEGLTIINLPTATLGPVQQALKRIMDLTLASCALTFAAPILLMIAIAIKLDSPGPVFFRQERTGQGGKSFRIFKFRSMTADAWQRRDTVSQLNQSDGPLFKMAQDPRVTRVGAIIRKTSLDELPQLINVVIGEMSLVGPRPLPTEEADRIDGAATARIDVKPGITGLWQVCGRSNLTYADLQHLDSAYVRSWSLLWDIRIMAKTPQVVFRRTGAY
jgi:exopolysaccharide biosynthesis polyprenyl glycosylphosphotransferase